METIELEDNTRRFKLRIDFNDKNCESDIIRNNISLLIKDDFVYNVLNKIFFLIINGFSFDHIVFDDLNKDMDSLIHRSMFRMGIDYEKAINTYKKEGKINNLDDYLLPNVE